MGVTSARKLAIITGASTGIGYALARECATHGFDLVVCGEDTRILSAAAELAGIAQVGVAPFQADLRTRVGVAALGSAVLDDGRPIGALLLTTGVGVGRPFLDTSLDQDLDTVALGCNHTVHLAKLLVPRMVAQGDGHVLLTAPVLGPSSSRDEAVHGAVRAFVMAFAEALRTELEGTRVTVTAIRPGVADVDPAHVARRGFAAMMDGKASVLVGGTVSKLPGVATQRT